MQLSVFVHYIFNAARPIRSNILGWTGRVDEISAYR